MAISGNQIKAARALVGMEQSELCERAGVSINTIRNMEATAERVLRVRLDTLYRVQDALKAAGVIFVEENGEGPGVRLKKKPLAVAEITEKILALDDKIATFDVKGEPSPAIGMNRLKKAHARNERTKLKNRRTKIADGPSTCWQR
jgi:transcriptional regulator with XRE-family HTH domain